MVINILMVLNTFGCRSWDISVLTTSLWVKELNKNSTNKAKIAKKTGIPYDLLYTYTYFIKIYPG